MWFEMAGKVCEFCQLTSIKGFPRLLRTTSVFMRCVWTISVIGFLCLTMFHATLHAMEYFQYNSFTSTGEIVMEYLNQTNRTMGPPDITLCNTNPFGSNRSLSKDLSTVDEYSKLAEQTSACDSECTEAENETLQHIRHEMMSTRGYFIHIGRHNARQLGHTLESFVVNYELDMEGGGVFHHSIPCVPTAQIIEIQHTMLYNCFTIRLPPNNLSDKVFRGFRVVIHLDDYEVLNKGRVFSNPFGDPGQMSGVWMFAHGRNKPLHTYSNRLMLQPGHFHDTPSKMELRTYLPTPHGRCQNIDGQEDYSLIRHYVDCVQNRVYDKCGCLDLQNYTSQWDPTILEGPVCLSLFLSKNELIRNWKFALRERTKAISDCAASIPLACEEIRYNLRVCHELRFPCFSHMKHG